MQAVDLAGLLILANSLLLLLTKFAFPCLRDYIWLPPCDGPRSFWRVDSSRLLIRPTPAVAGLSPCRKKVAGRVIAPRDLRAIAQCGLLTHCPGGPSRITRIRGDTIDGLGPSEMMTACWADLLPWSVGFTGGIRCLAPVGRGFNRSGPASVWFPDVAPALHVYIIDGYDKCVKYLGKNNSSPPWIGEDSNYPPGFTKNRSFTIR